MKRHQDLSLRKPESTSLSRSIAFNKPVVDDFFNKYIFVIEKNKFHADQIWNLDETGITTVMKPVKVVSTKGKKQVGQISSAERGVLVTFVGIINAIGRSLPPIFVYPRIRNPSEYLSEGAPTGSVALGNKSGWMTSELFLEVLKHIVHHTKCTDDNKILLLLDNHESHISIEAIRYCKCNGIVLLSFPPHTTHRLQPLDVGVYAPFKTYLATAFNDWMLAHPGQAITIRNISYLANKAYENAFSVKNIQSAFKKTGLWPPDRLVFKETDFTSSMVTDRPLASDNDAESSQNTSFIEQNISEPQNDTSIVEKLDNVAVIEMNPDQPSTSGQNINRKKCRRRGPSLEELYPYPKADITKKRRKGRKSKSTVYTDTPELLNKQNLELEKKRKLELKNKREVVKRNIFEKASQSLKVKIVDSSSSDSDASLDEVYSRSSSDLEEFEALSNSDFENGDFVLVKFPTKTTIIHYIGRVENNINDHLLSIKFMRRKGNGQTFVFPDVEDVTEIDSLDIVAKLHTPSQTGTARTASIYTFNYNFSNLVVK